MTLYMIPDAGNIKECETFAREHGLCYEYNDFFWPRLLDDPEALEERIAFYEERDRDFSKDTMHGAFFDVTVFSVDAKIREVSLSRMRQSLKIAERLGLRGVVFHGNYLPFLRSESYDGGWLHYTEEAIRMLAKEFPGTEIFMENMFDDTPEMLEKLAERLGDVKNFGICLDYSHAQLISKEGQVWFERLGKYIRHIHVNDHRFAGDVHMAPGTGMTDWEEFFQWKKQYAPEATVLCEVTGMEKTKEGILFLKKSGR